jgi:hypothetical protein
MYDAFGNTVDAYNNIPHIDMHIQKSQHSIATNCDVEYAQIVFDAYTDYAETYYQNFQRLCDGVFFVNSKCRE